VDTEAERQGEILAFYGEEETRNYDSPEPGPVVEKDDATTKETAVSEQVGQNTLLYSELEFVGAMMVFTS